MELLRTDNPERNLRNGTLRSIWLKWEFENVLQDIKMDDERLHPYVRTCILLIIGTLLLPDSEKSIFPILYLAFLRDISVDALNGFAWGAALFAKLHSSLSDGLKNFKVASWILEICFIVFFMLTTF